MSGGNESLKALAFRKSPRSQEALRTPTESSQTRLERQGSAQTLSSREYSQSAVKRRAQEIGIKEQQLYWIAEKSLQNPLPAGWIEAATDDGYVYFFNEETGESIWHHPALDHYKKQYATILQQRQAQHIEYEVQKQKMRINPMQEWQELEANGRSALPRLESNASIVSNLSVPSPNAAAGGRHEQAQVVTQKAAEEAGLPQEPENDFSRVDMGGKHPADYWFERFESCNREKRRVEIQMEAMEGKVTSAVIEQSELMHDKHDLALACKKMSVCLSEANEKACAALESRGHDRSDLPLTESNGGENKGEDVKDEEKKSGTVHISDRLAESAAASTRLIAYLASERYDQCSDDRGYKRSWEGVSKRITEEMRDCFPSTGNSIASGVRKMVGLVMQGEEHVMQEEKAVEEDRSRRREDLKTRLAALAQIIIAFGEYVPAQDRTYLPPLIKHIRQQAPGSELVPLDAFATSISKDKKYTGEETSLQEQEALRETLGIEPPSSIHELRKLLQQERDKASQLQSRLDLTKHQYELVHTKLVGAEARLTDSMAREEATLARFNSLSDSLQKMAHNNTSNGNGGGAKATDVKGEPIAEDTDVPAPPKSTGLTTADLKDLVDKLALMTSEVEHANKRTRDAERRIEELLAKESRLREQDLPELKVKLERKKQKNQDLCAKLVELETLSKAYYADLQTALHHQNRAESQLTKVQEQLEREREKRETAQHAGNATAKHITEQLQSKLQDEMSRNKHMEKTVADAQAELADQKDDNTKLANMNKVLTNQMARLREVGAERDGDITALRERNERLESERTSAVNKVTELKRLNFLLNEKIIDLQGNIRVFARMRPASETEQEKIRPAEMAKLVRFPDFNTLEFDNYPFEFDRTFDAQASQEDCYEEVLPAVRTVMTGSRLCIFAYGQTGSGKTHTMMGDYAAYFRCKKAGKMPPEDLRGVNVRALQSVFALAAVEAEEVRTLVKMSMVEVYNERIIDLLNNDTEEAEAENKRAGGRGVDLPGLEVRLGKDGSFVEGLSEWDVAGEEEVLALIEKGQGLRKVASNNINEHSSRSHLVIIVKVYRENFVSGAMTSGYMTLVDLAGSERLKTTGASGQRLREAQHINKSLSSLGDVISALGSGLKHVPYRNSKLTFLLQDSLREKSKVLMFVNISPIPGFSSESVCSLQFAQRCRAVQLGAAASNKIYR